MERDKKSWLNLHNILREENATLQAKIVGYQKVIEQQQAQLEEV
jgi:hypothetical protein